MRACPADERPPVVPGKMLPELPLVFALAIVLAVLPTSLLSSTMTAEVMDTSPGSTAVSGPSSW